MIPVHQKVGIHTADCKSKVMLVLQGSMYHSAHHSTLVEDI